MEKRLMLITGSPGVGKTTVLMRIVEALKVKGYTAGGMISRDVRIHGSRLGFEVLDLATGRKGWLASVDQKLGPKVGKYRVNLDDLNGIGVNAILEALRTRDLVVIDEIGPMELFSQRFKDAVTKIVENSKLVICTVHWKMSTGFIDEIKGRQDSETYVVTYGNREHLPEIIVEEARNLLQRTYKNKRL